MSDERPENESPENSNGLKAFELLEKYLEDDGWYPRRIDNKYGFSMGYTGKNGDLRCFAMLNVELEEFLFYAVAPVKIPEVDRPAVAEYLTRANYGMRIGNFEMDYRDGEVRYKSSMDFENEALTPGYLHNTIYPAVETMDRYLPGLLRVSFGGASPLEAIEEIESPPPAPPQDEG